MECGHKFTMCRLCLCESESFIDIFQVNALFGYVAAEVIKDLLQFQVSETDGYPHVLCSTCFGKLADFKRFKEKCQDFRDIYDDLFESEESRTELPIDIEEQMPVKLEPKDLLDAQESHEESDCDPEISEEEETTTDDILPQIRKCSGAFPSLDRLARLRKRTSRESYAPYENIVNGVNDDGKPLAKRGEGVAVDAGPCENINPSGFAKVHVGKMNVIVRRVYTSQDEVIYMPPVEKSDANVVGSGAGEGMKRLEELNYVETSVDERVSDSEGGSERGAEANEGEEETERLSCKDCGKGFEKKDELIRHLELHGYEVNEGSGTDEGGEFEAGTNVQKGLEMNMPDEVTIEGEFRKYVCELCGKGFSCIGNLKTHFRVHTGEKPFGCAVCDKRFSTKYSLVSHIFTHTGEKPYTCHVCRKGFTKNNSLSKHMRTHTGEKRYVCEVCGKGFAEKIYFTFHMRIHNGDRPYICEVCGRTFTQNSILVMHRRTHTGEKPFKCSTCGKLFAHSGSLTKHRQAHTGERPHVCQVCEKGFRDVSALRNHLRTHSQERPFECQVCNRLFGSRTGLGRHFMIHTGRKPHSCDVCNKCFRNRYSLRTHIRTHTKEKPYRCKLCDKCFGDNSTLRKHFLRIHSHEIPC